MRDSEHNCQGIGPLCHWGRPPVASMYMHICGSYFIIKALVSESPVWVVGRIFMRLYRESKRGLTGGT